MTIASNSVSSCMAASSGRRRVSKLETTAILMPADHGHKIWMVLDQDEDA